VINVYNNICNVKKYAASHFNVSCTEKGIKNLINQSKNQVCRDQNRQALACLGSVG
jgi:hypothetical protein